MYIVSLSREDPESQEGRIGMAKRSDPNTPPRTPLSRERVLRAAVDLADREGLDALTMRKLGQELGVEAMSLYNHVDNKDDILDGIVDIVVGEIDLPAKDGDWKAEMHQRAVSARNALARHEWATGVLESRTGIGPATMQYYDAVIGCLREAGFSIAMAAHAFSVLDSYIYGFALQEVKLPFETEEELANIADMLLQAIPKDEFPYFTEMIVDHALQSGYDYGDMEFEYGLNLILEGLERALDDS